MRKREEGRDSIMWVEGVEILLRHQDKLVKPLSEESGWDTGKGQIVFPESWQEWEAQLQKSVKDYGGICVKLVSSTQPGMAALVVCGKETGNPYTLMEEGKALGFFINAAKLRELRATIDLAIVAAESGGS